MTIPTMGQVGINTTDPQATLDVNGSLRIRGMNDDTQPEIYAKRLLGVDATGTVVEVEVEDRLLLEENILSTDNGFRFRDSDILDVLQIYDLRIVILPGEPNDDRRIMSLISPLALININGIEAANDGDSVWLFAASGIVQLQGLNLFALPQDQILTSGTYTLDQFEMVQLVYNGNLQKWLIMDN